MTPSEKFYEVLDKYKYSGVEPIESWATEDLLDLQEAIRAELHDRDVLAQQEYFEPDEPPYIDDEIVLRGRAHESDYDLDDL